MVFHQTIHHYSILQIRSTSKKLAEIGGRDAHQRRTSTFVFTLYSVSSLPLEVHERSARMYTYSPRVKNDSFVLSSIQTRTPAAKPSAKYTHTSIEYALHGWERTSSIITPTFLPALFVFISSFSSYLFAGVAIVRCVRVCCLCMSARRCCACVCVRKLRTQVRALVHSNWSIGVLLVRHRSFVNESKSFDFSPPFVFRISRSELYFFFPSFLSLPPALILRSAILDGVCVFSVFDVSLLAMYVVRYSRFVFRTLLSIVCVFFLIFPLNLHCSVLHFYS